MGSDPAGSDPIRVFFFLLLAFLLTGATTNFTSRRTPKEPAPPATESTTEQPEPKPVELAPVPKPEPAPVETPVGSDPIGGQTPSGLEVPAAEPAEIILFDTEEPHSHPSAQGVQSHGYSPEKPIPITASHMITQEVWLDPADPPKGIALKLKLSTGDEVAVYWEGEEEVFKPQQGQELWYYGPLPELGEWTKLEILAEDMGLEEAQITGIQFVTRDGRALWDRTLLTAAPPIEEADAVFDQPMGIRPLSVNGD